MTEMALDLIRSFAASIEDPKARLAYCAARVEDAKEYSREAGKVMYAAGRVLGWPSETARNRMSLIHRRGLDGALKWMWELSRRDALATIAPLDLSLVGWVYHARVVEDPTVFKVGFSRKPDARLKQLQSEYGITLELISTTPGTMLDEFAWHRAHSWHEIGHEWFNVPGSGRKGVPDFILKKYSPAFLRSVA